MKKGPEGPGEAWVGSWAAATAVQVRDKGDRIRVASVKMGRSGGIQELAYKTNNTRTLSD